MSKRNQKKAEAPAMRAAVGHPLSRLRGGSWATARFAEAMRTGKALSSAIFRTNDVLRHEEWKHFDEVLVEEYLKRIVGVADLQAAGLTRPVPNSLGKTEFDYELVTYMDDAKVTMSGLSHTDNDRQEFSQGQIPLPMTHKDFWLDLRTLTASRERGEPLDTIQVRTAGRVIAEAAETLLFQGGGAFGNALKKIYGYTTFPNRYTSGYGTGGNWTSANFGTKTPAEILNDVITMKQTLVTNRHYGPYWVYVSTDSETTLDQDYAVGTPSAGLTTVSKTIKDRILMINNVEKVQVSDFLPAATVIMVQADMNTVAWVQGETLQTIQWDADGGFKINFKAFQIGVPLIRADIQNRAGIVHMS